jgi:hypothetical protein
MHGFDLRIQAWSKLTWHLAVEQLTWHLAVEQLIASVGSVGLARVSDELKCPVDGVRQCDIRYYKAIVARTVRCQIFARFLAPS